MASTSPETQRRNRPGKVGLSGRNKPRARVVCTNCRQRKIKCDAEKISPGERCSHCTSSDSPCILDRVDGRRKPRHHDATLQARLQYLENLVVKHTVTVDQVDRQGARGDMQGSSAGITGSLDTECSPHSASLPLNANQGAENAALPLQTAETHGFDRATERRSSLTSVPPTLREGRRYSQATPDVSQLCDAQERILTQPGSRPLQTDTGPPTKGVELNSRHDVAAKSVAVDENGGGFPYYGPTTQPHIRSPPDGALLAGGEDDIAPNMPLNMDSIPLRRTLINIFFSLQPRFQPLVDQDLFLRDWAHQKRTQYYSKFLEDALLAFSTRHSTSSAVRKLGYKYAERCKTKIALELDNPNIASLSGFLLLGDFEAGRGRARIGWTYCVIASGLMVDLGLHVDFTDLVNRGKLTAREAEARNSLLLSMFVYAVLWSLYLGRPNPMSQLTLHAVRQAAPEVSSTWVGFCTRMLDIIDILNGPASLSGLSRETSERLLELDLELCSFVHPLHSEDSQSDELDANSYALEMQFCGIRILLRRAILKSKVVSDPICDVASREDEPLPVSRDQLYASMHDDAIRIAQLILSYHRIYGIQDIVTVMIDNIFVASVALISHVHRVYQNGQSADKAVHWLHFLSRTLNVMGKHFPITLRMQNYLASIVENSPLSPIFPRTSNTSPSAISDARFEVLYTPPQTLEVPGPRGENELADVNMLSTFDFTALDDNNGIWLPGSAWNMTPIFDEGGISF